MEEFTETILSEMQEGKSNLSDEVVQKYVPLIREMQASLRKADLMPDIEAILTILQARAKPKKALVEIGPGIMAFARDLPQTILTVVDEVESFAVLSEIEELIYQKCLQIDPKLAVNLYGNSGLT